MTGTPTSWRYRPELDGLRTLAVVVIVFFHARVSGASSSFIVLDLFFVLSGFLVTNVVLTEMDTTGRLRLGRYYARRVRRLLPAAVVTIILTSVVFVMVASQPERLMLVRHAQAALVYLANWQFIADGADYFAGDIRESPFMHFWSLSIEEQYYILFPLLLVAWWKLAPGRGRLLLAGLGVLAAMSVASQLYWAQVEPTRAYFATDARLFQLLAGAMVAVALREFATPSREGGIHWARAGRVLAVAGLTGYVVFGAELVDMSVSHRNLLATLLAGALVVGTYTAPGSLVARFFALPWMTYLGKISYGIYLWHYPVLLALDRVFTVRPVVVAVMALVGATALASLSYQLLENPIRRGKVLDPFPWPSVATGVAASVVAALVVVGPILGSQRAPSIATTSASPDGDAAEVALADGDPVRAKLSRKVPEELDFRRISNDKGPPDTWCTPATPEDCQVVDGDGPHLVVVGDSHARMLAPAFEELARENGFRLSLSVVAACPWQDGIYNLRVSEKTRDRCLDARRGFYDRTLPRLEPDVVVLVNLARSDRSWEKYIATYGDAEAGPLHELQRDAVDRTLEKVTAAGARAVMVKSILGTEGWDRGGFDPLDCLARAERQRECTVTPPLDRPVADALYESAAVGNDDAATVDLNPVFCPDSPACRPIIDGRVVWRDNRHTTGEIGRHLRKEIFAAIRDTGLLDG
jgi:peptidoglycan/LPS O-acetylase OafA/YrhL